MAGKGNEVGHAYVGITPKVDDGFKSTLAKEMPKGDSEGKKFGKGFESGMKPPIGAAAVAIGNLLSDAIKDAANAVVDITRQAFGSFAEYEQLQGGVEKIFDQANIRQIMEDAQNAYADLNMSANQYLESMNQVGATFAQTMGDQKGYDTARTGMKAIADYASGTGRNLDELNDKYVMITRASSSYQSIADQFSGILPATSADFLEQAQAAGLLSDEYTKLTDVPIAEYQEAVTGMLEKGVADMGLAGNTLAESTETVSGSMAMMQSAWENWLTALGSEDIDVSAKTDQLIQSLYTAAENAVPVFVRIAGSLAEQAPAFFDAALVAFGQISVATPEVAPQVIAAILTLALQAVAGLIGAAPEIAAGALRMFGGIVSGLVRAIPDIIMTLVTLIPQLALNLASGAGQLLGAAFQLFGNITQALVDVGNELADMLYYVVTHLPEIVAEAAGGMVAAGQEFFDGIVNGFLGVAPEMESTAAEATEAAVTAAEGQADASAVGEKMSSSLMDGYDFSAFQLEAAQGTEGAVEAAAASADAAPISEKLSETAAGGIDMKAMNEPAVQMVDSAIDAAKAVDASEVGQAFSASAAGGVDTSAMDGAASALAGAVKSMNATATVSVKADLSGVNALRSAAASVQGAYRSLASSVASSMTSAAGAAARSAAQVSAAIRAIPSSKKVTISVGHGHIAVPHFSISGELNVQKHTVPTVNVSWWKTGAIFDEPTIFANGVGEAGPEAVMPIDKLPKLLGLDSNGKSRGDVNIYLDYHAGEDAVVLVNEMRRAIRLQGLMS